MSGSTSTVLSRLFRFADFKFLATGGIKHEFEAFWAAAARRGRIVAIKGLGGFI